MKDRPEGVRESELVSALADGWGFTVASLSYLPIGAGSYHWSMTDGRGRRRFVTVDDLGPDEASRDGAFRALGSAFGTALALRDDARLDFVVAPIPDLSGSPVRRLGSRYSLTMFPWQDGQAGSFGPHAAEDRAEVAALIAELHQATAAVAAIATRTDLILPGRAGLHDALADLDREWTGGPFSEPARRLLATHAEQVEQLLADFDRLVERVRATGGDWVVTHGEPHPGNLIRGVDGLRLIDWDTVRIAPAERDLWMIADDSGQVLEGYSRATGRTVHAEALSLYRLWWDLADIAIYVDELRRPHRSTEDITASWTYLNRYLR